MEAEIRKLLHEVSRIAEQALVRARKVKEDGEPAVQAGVESTGSVRTGSDRAPRVHTAAECSANMNPIPIPLLIVGPATTVSSSTPNTFLYKSWLQFRENATDFAVAQPPLA